MPQRGPETSPASVSAPLASGSIDPSRILSLQASAGNAAVAALLQRAPAVTAAAPSPPPLSPDARRALLDQLHNDSRSAAHAIKEILTGNTYLGSGNQAQIMEIVRHWAQVAPAPSSKMTGMDWLIAGLTQNTYEVGTLVKQTTSAFDELHRRLGSDNAAELKRMIAENGRQFKNSKPNELAQFEVSQEDVVRGLKAGAELTAAVATGGGSMVLQVVSWLASTLPKLWDQIKAVFNLVDAIKSFKASGVGSKFNPGAVGALAVSALFGEMQGLPVLGGPEPPKAEESSHEASGLTKVLMSIVRGITVVKGAYNKVATKVNGILSSFNISEAGWLKKAAMAYAGIATAIDKVSDPGAALGQLADGVKTAVGGFFNRIKEHLGEIAGEIKGKLAILLDPAQLLHNVADRLVSTVLNFIITSPPSELLRTVFSVIQTAAGKDLIDVVREQLKPVGDTIIDKIANSSVVQGALSPLKGPVHKIADGIGAITDKGLGVVHEVEDKISSFLAPEKLREMAGMGEAAAAPVAVAAAAAEPSGFLEVVKHGLHSHLMAIGKSHLLAAGKQLATTAWDKTRSAAKSAFAGVKGAIFGRRQEFDAAGHHHQLWAEQGEGGLTLMMASTPTPLEQRIADYEAGLKEGNAAENELKDLRLQVEAAKKLGPAAAAASRDQALAAATRLEQIEKRIAVLVQHLESALMANNKQPEYRQDGRGRPIIAASQLGPTHGDRDMGAEAAVSRPLTQLFELFQQQGGTWQAAEEYGSKERPTFDAAHLIPHAFGGSSGRENLVPIEARVNKSFMGAQEGAIRDEIKAGGSYYAIVRCIYRDSPPDLSDSFRVPAEKNDKSGYAKGTRVKFNLMAIESVPDEVSVKVVNLKDGKTRYEENYPTGGPLIDWVGKTRAELAAEQGPEAVNELLDPQKRAAYIEKQKAGSAR